MRMAARDGISALGRALLAFLHGEVFIFPVIRFARDFEEQWPFDGTDPIPRLCKGVQKVGPGM